MSNRKSPGQPSGQRPKRARAASGDGLTWKPGLIAGALALLWAAANEPPSFETGDLMIWLLGSVTAGLLARAALALVKPLVRIIGTRVRRAIQETRDGTGGA